MAIFKGCGTAIVTPMAADGSVNYEIFGKLIDFQVENKIDSIIVCGTTGESSTLTDDEHRECIRFCVEKVAKRVPVIAGTGSNDTAYAVELSKDAEKLGADGLLLVTPYYNKCSQTGLVKHFTKIADSVNIPIILYDVKSRTGMDIAVETYKTLSEHPHIVAVKEANGDVAKIARIINACGENLDIYSGNDTDAVAFAAVGAKGLISVASNIYPLEFHNMLKFALEGDFRKAMEIQLKYLTVIDNLFSETNPIPVKAALSYLGYNVGVGRLPLCEMGQANFDKLKTALDNIK